MTCFPIHTYTQRNLVTVFFAHTQTHKGGSWLFFYIQWKGTLGPFSPFTHKYIHTPEAHDCFSTHTQAQAKYKMVTNKELTNEELQTIVALKKGKNLTVYLVCPSLELAKLNLSLSVESRFCFPILSIFLHLSYSLTCLFTCAYLPFSLIHLSTSQVSLFRMETWLSLSMYVILSPCLFMCLFIYLSFLFTCVSTCLINLAVSHPGAKFNSQSISVVLAIFLYLYLSTYLSLALFTCQPTCLINSHRTKT